MPLLQPFQDIFFRTLIPLLIALAFAFSAQAQVKPDLDPDIPPYQRTKDLSGPLFVAGSETMKPLTESWAATLQERYSGLKIKVESVGSEAGMAALLEGKAQIAALSRRMTQQEVVEFKREFGYEPTEVPVAVDALAVFVHKDNPIEKLSLAQLDAMFSKERRRGWPYPVNTWGDVLVLEEGWTDAPIHLYGRNSSSGTASFFKEHVLNGAALKNTMTAMAGSASVVQEVTIDRFGVGFSGIGYQTSEIRPVPLASAEGGRYVLPNFQTAMDGSYPLRRNLYLYLNKPPKIAGSSPLTEYVKFALSRQGQQIVLSHGYYPLQTTELNRLAMMWKTPLRTSTAEEPGKVPN